MFENYQSDMIMKIVLRIYTLCILLSVMNYPLLAQQQYLVVGYYTMWGKSTLPVSSVKFNELTHINHAFAWPTASGSITSDPVTVDTALIGATHRAGRKILISIGGASMSTYFPTVATDTTLRRTFINNLVNYIVNNHYDGADFDWEGPSNFSQKTGDLALMKQTREAFNAIDHTLLLTMAIGSDSYSGQWRYYDSLSLYVDWFNVMTYDLDQSYSGFPGYNAALYYHNISGDYSADQSITYLKGRSIPSSKLVVGVPFYGKRFFGTTSPLVKFYSMTTAKYSEILPMVQSPLYTRTWDNTAKVPYLTKGSPQSEMVTYDDSMSIALKCQFIKSKGLLGVMIWEISQDVIGRTQPLLDVITKEMLTPNNIVEQLSESRITSFTLYDNYPNPFNPTTTIKFTIPQPAHISLKVFDLLGREVATLINEERSAGSGSVVFDASHAGISSGVYFYRLVSGTFTQTKKCLLAK
jgi:chitinase